MNQLFKDGAFPIRINSTGIYDASKGVFRPGGGTKGVSDVIACYKGRFIAPEVKIGRDKQSDEQIGFQKNLEHCGGFYFVAKTFDQFLIDWNIIKSKINSHGL